MDYHKAQFIKSVADLRQLPPDEGIEIAFAGRSNAGKSSALNTLAHKKIARTSKTPGRTQLINLFALDEKRRLVDLPGYGYAEVPQSIKERWQITLGEYLQERHCLKGLVLLMDCRHPLKELDTHMIAWAKAGNLPVHLLLTKSDKLSKSQKLNTLRAVEKTLTHYSEASVQLFSAVSAEGLDELKAKLDMWYHEQ
jgi:GTP-binding protein